MLDPNTQRMLFDASAVLLPLVPAFLLFAFLPSTGEAKGPFMGLQIKFGGAFAGYLVVFLVMWYSIPKDMQHHYQQWTIKGVVKLRHPEKEQEPNIRTVVCRVIPPKFDVENDGSFSLEVLVPEDDQGRPKYPDLDINLADYGGVTVPISGRSASGYGSPPIPLRVDGETIELMSPIVLTSTALQPNYGPETFQTPKPDRTAPVNQ
jgi:hypothetical protein